MKNPLAAAFRCCATLLILFLLTGAKDSTVSAPQVDQNAMVAHFIDVGQGAATLLEFPCGTVLIDAGAQDAAYERDLINYLNTFFSTRPHLDRTIDLIIVTHAHKDHNLVLDNIVGSFKVKRYIDNGMTIGSGKVNQKWLQRNALRLGVRYGSWSSEQIHANGNRNGMTNAIIDPIDCDVVDPEIVLYSGRYETKPGGWSDTDFRNGNNHSLVVKVVFGGSSFMFTGDLEEDGIRSLLSYYSADNLDASVLLAGHHGSDNAVTEDLLNAVTPSYAVISCGIWTYGLDPGDDKIFNTYNYGHPRIATLDLLAAACPEERSPPLMVKAAVAGKTFIDVPVTKRIYCTAWDRNIRITATKEGNYSVTVLN